MKGLELSRAYWEKCALPLFRRELPAFLERAAVGLVGVPCSYGARQAYGTGRAFVH